MKQGEIVRSFTALMWLGNQHMNRNDAWAVFELTESAEKVIQFQAAEEQKLVEKYGAETDGNGMYKFKDHDSLTKFEQGLNELRELEAEGLNPLKISLAANPDITISPKEIKDLKGVVDIVKG